MKRTFQILASHLPPERLSREVVAGVLRAADFREGYHALKSVFAEPELENKIHAALEDIFSTNTNGRSTQTAAG